MTHRSARALAQSLAAHGIDAQVGVYGLDTAIRAEIRGAGAEHDDVPTLAILSEYDALPGVGHGCGHNVIAVMGLGAFPPSRRSPRRTRRPCRDASWSSAPPPRRATRARSTWRARAPSRGSTPR